MRFTSLETDAAARASISKCVLLSRPTEIITSSPAGPGWPWLAPSLRQDFNCLLICEMAVWSSELFNLKKEKLENREIDRQEKVASLIRAPRDFQQQQPDVNAALMSRPLFRGGSPPPYATDFYTHTRRTDARKQLKKKKNLSTRLTFQCRATQTNLWWGVEREREKRKRNKKQKIQPNEIQEEI